jgi:outer membrane protein assembly factor BamB
MLTTIFPLFAPSTVNAANWVNTYAFSEPMTNPTGVGQSILIWAGITDACNWPQPGWAGLTVTVTRPDGKTETLGPFSTDTTGTTGLTYMPTMVGNYTFQTHFPEQKMLYDDTGFAPAEEQGLPAGTLLKASDGRIGTLVVQQDPVQKYPGTPLPTEYWTRPINAQFREWQMVASNWLRSSLTTTYTTSSQAIPIGIGPESGHILWKTQAVDGGLVGIDLIDKGYETGDAYEGKWTGFIIDGTYYRNVPWPSQSAYQGIYAIDLATGKQKWFLNNTRMGLGQVMYFDTFNLQGAYAYIWDTSGGTTWKAYDAYTGAWWFTLTNVPVNQPMSYIVYGPKGEILIYNVDIDHGWMTLWNSTNVPGLRRTTDQLNTYFYNEWRPYGKIVNATGKCNVNFETPLGLGGYMWNKTIPTGLARSAIDNNRTDQGGVRKIRGDVMLGSNTEKFTKYPNPVSFWALSLKPGEEGKLLFNVNYPALPGNLTEEIRDASVEDGVFVVAVKETCEWYGYSLKTGEKLWGPTQPQELLDWVGFAQTSWTDVIADGKLYSGSFSGVMHCYDVKTGKLLWTYHAIDQYGESPFGPNWCLGIEFVVDDKIYIGDFEHSGNSPLPRGAPYICLNATTGEEIWTLPLRTTIRDSSTIIADGIMIIPSTYDMNDYAIGKGPSAIAVTTSPKVSTLGHSLLIEGTVTDVSSGTEDYDLRARFPNGVPAVSDASMTEWMEYVYMQYPRPTDVTGVEVTLNVVDSNGNFRQIGTTTSDSDGYFSFPWTPDISGKYTVYAEFEGSKSYWPSHAVTAFNVDSAAPTPAPTAEPIQSLADLYFVPAIAGLFVLVAIIGVVIILVLRKRP